MKDSLTYNHSFEDYSIELELELEVYRPRFPDIDDVAEVEILSAKAKEDVGDYKTGQNFNIDLLDNDKVTDEYFNQ